MFFKGKVTNVDDPDNLGRIQADLYNFNPDAAGTCWCYPVSAFAGSGYGFYRLPKIGDDVLLAQTEDETWFWLGGLWRQQKPIPAAAGENILVLRTPGGHQIKMADTGDMVISDSNGSTITLKSNGIIEIDADGDIHLNGSGGKVVTTQCVCCFTGKPHPQGSLTVKAKGII